MMKERLRPLFYPESVCVVGASATPGKWGFGILHNILAGGFAGRVFPVNKKGGFVQGMEATVSIAELPEAPDLALVMVPPESVVPSLNELVKKGVRAAVIYTGGFAELGAQGRAMQEEIARVAKSAGIPVLGPNCMGLINARADLQAQIMLMRPTVGGLSIISQSGNIVSSILHYGNVNQIGFNLAVSSGNEAALDLTDLLEYMGEDDDTAAVLMYVEGIDDGRRFLDTCRRVSLKKPVVILKGGQSEAGGRACASHTGHLAGSGEVWKAVERQAGAIMVEDIDELFHVAAAACAHPRPQGRRVGIVTMGGGWGVLATDACQRAGLEVPPLDRPTIEALNGFLADRWSHRNPVDMAATPDPAAMIHALEAVAASPSVDMVIQTNLGFGGAAKKNLRDLSAPGARITMVVKFPEAVVDYIARNDMQLAEAIIRLREEYGKPILSCTDVIIGDGVAGNRTLEFMAKHGIPVYPTPVKAAMVLGKMQEYARWREAAGGKTS